MIDKLEYLSKLDLPFELDEVSPICHQCVLDQLEKYDKYIGPKGEKAAGKFIVPCHGIKNHIIDPIELAAMSDKEAEMALASLDIVHFAAKYLFLPDGTPWIARWYQEPILRCTSKRKVLRISRRCMVPGTPVLMADGTWKAIEKIKKGEFVASRNKKNQLVRKEVTLEYDNGIQDVYEIKLSNGRQVTCTSNHPLLAFETITEGQQIREVWKSIDDGLCVGTKVVVAKHYDKDLFGYMLADETIKSITPKGKSQTYDIGVKDHHNFIADGIVCHNTGKTDGVVVDILYSLYTNENIKILVAGPQKSHTEEIFTRVRSFIRKNPFLSKSVVRDVSAPWYEILLQNGARLRGFAAGTKGKQEGVGIRGQDADKILIEEMDYIDKSAVIGAIFPILQTTPDTSLVGFSTPTGFRTPYYSLCEENPAYKEFHYDYKVLPWWKNVEAERSSFTEEKWTHEYLALWGDAESGVYKPSYIDRSLHNYDYETLQRNPSWRYTIGTDWNEKHGTEIVVLGFNPNTNMFQVVETLLIEKSEFTQLSGVAKLLEMNRKWKPNFIYIDSGGGSTNHELLRKTAYDNSTKDGNRDTARLLTILKKYDSGSAIEIKDPVTKEKRRAPAKSFMVNASVRMFEQNRIIISSSDSVLEKQLRNYVIERLTPTGNEVYGMLEDSIGDHRLDALNLAIVAFHLEFDDLHATRIMMEVGAVPDPRAIKLRENRKIVNERTKETVVHGPEDRRLEGPGAFEKTWAEKQVFGVGHAGPTQGIRHNRPGWATDEEDKHVEKFLQRRRSRGNLSKNRPTRTTF